MLNVNIHNLKLKNPVMTASGTFGYGEEFADFVDLERLGGFIVKGTTGTHREGNPYPRMAETPSGMLNAVGLQNGGVGKFCSEVYHRIKHLDTNIIVNVSGSSIEEYCSVAEQIDALDKIPAIELNISCPNVKKGGMGFGTNPDMAAQAPGRHCPQGQPAPAHPDVAATHSFPSEDAPTAAAAGRPQQPRWPYT